MCAKILLFHCLKPPPPQPSPEIIDYKKRCPSLDWINTSQRILTQKLPCPSVEDAGQVNCGSDMPVLLEHTEESSDPSRFIRHSCLQIPATHVGAAPLDSYFPLHSLSTEHSPQNCFCTLSTSLFLHVKVGPCCCPSGLGLSQSVARVHERRHFLGEPGTSFTGIHTNSGPLED